jgi:hypothetical protein
MRCVRGRERDVVQAASYRAAGREQVDGKKDDTG